MNSGESVRDRRAFAFDDLGIILDVAQFLAKDENGSNRREERDAYFQRTGELTEKRNPCLRLFDQKTRLTRQLFTGLIDTFLVFVTFRNPTNNGFRSEKEKERDELTHRSSRSERHA